jgi:hypothetical protein
MKSNVPHPMLQASEGSRPQDVTMCKECYYIRDLGRDLHVDPFYWLYVRFSYY